MNIQWLIIDGYNLLHQVDSLVDLVKTDIALARHRLVRLIENTALEMAPQTTVVFDGREAGQDEELTTSGLEIYFSSGDQTADTVIERLVERYAEPHRIFVVTSDVSEAATVASSGAQVMSATEFIARCERTSGKTIGRRMRPGEQPKLGDVFPDGF